MIAEKTQLVIKILGNDHKSTQKAAQEICAFMTANNAEVASVFRLPTIRKFIYSPRRCHFIYKESRDQFTVKTHKTVVLVKFDTSTQMNLRDKMKNVHVPAGVSVSMNFQKSSASQNKN